MSNRMIFPYIPYFYFIKTRLKGNLQKVSWVFVYFIPIGFFYYHYSHLVGFIYFVITYYAVNLIYENGYIWNDVVTVRKEKSPTHRLTKCQYEYIDKNLSLIISSRLFLLLGLLLWLFLSYPLYYVLFFLFLLILLQVFFSLYNRIRNRANLFLIIPMSYLRFYAPIVPLLYAEGNYVSIFLLIFLYPILKFLEFCRQPRYRMENFSKLVGVVDRFRVFYYFFLTLLFLLINNFLELGDALPLLYASGYYLFYRIVGYWLYISNYEFRRKVQEGAKKDYRK